LLIKGRRVYTGSGEVIDGGMVLIAGGKIVRVGKDFPVDPGVRLLQAESVIPGLVDMHSHAGVFTLPLVPETMDGNETTNPVTPELRALDGLNFSDPDLLAGLAGGVTTIVIRPGSANVVGGMSTAIKLKHAPPEELVLKEPCDLKMTIEYNPVGFYGKKGRSPSTLMTVYHLARQAFIQAQEYELAWKDYEKRRSAGEDIVAPRRDLGKENLLLALRREIPVHVHVCTAAEIMSAVRLADEFNLKLSLAHAPYAYLIVDELALRPGIHYNVGPTTLITYYQDGLKLKNVAAILAGAGLPVSLEADTVGRWQANLLYFASVCVRYGMSPVDALKAVTIRGAEGVGLEGRIGSLEAGKDADLVLLNGDPFELTTSVEATVVDGRLEFQGDKRPAFRTDIPDHPLPLTLPPGLAEAEGFAVRGGTILTIAGPPLSDGIMLVQNGKILRIGRGLAVPEGWPAVDARDYVVMPGLVNARSHLGLEFNARMMRSVDETSQPAVPEMEAKHAIDPQSPDFHFARQLGLTSALVTPGNLNVIGGRGAVLKTAGEVVDRMIIKDRAVLVIGLGDPARRAGSSPQTRMGIISILRDKLLKARQYEARKEPAGEEEGARIDPSSEALLPVLAGRTPIMVHCDRKDDIQAAFRLADEFNLRLVLAGGTEAHKMVDEIRSRNVPVVLERVFRRTTRADDGDFDARTPAILSKKGVTVAFKAEDGGTWTRPPVAWGGGDLLEIAALAVKSGMDPEAALRAVTLDAAAVIGAADRVGSLEEGKDADFLILGGHPLRVRALPQAVFIDGKLVYAKEKREHVR
jgi:imidazolonepropionase-like amidohydrolase